MEWVARPPIAPTHLQFLEKLSGLTLGEDPKEGIFEKTRFLHLDMDFSLRFPDGWRLINDRDVVGAIEPSHKAFIALRIEGPGDDPQAMARKVIETARKMLKTKRGSLLELLPSTPPTAALFRSTSPTTF